MKNIEQTYKSIRAKIEQEPARSAWCKGVKRYAMWIIKQWYEDTIANNDDELPELTRTYVLNGSKDWRELSASGNYLIFDKDIAKYLCTPSELKITKNGEREPNKHEDWIDVQARALFQAYLLIQRCIKLK